MLAACRTSTLLLLFLVMAAPVQAQGTLCTKQEKVAFSCPVGKKIVSLCASADLSETSGYVQYRYGTKDKVELVYPDTLSHPRAHFEFGSNDYTGGHTDYYLFNNNGVDYIVYSGLGWQWRNEGLVVEKDGKRLSSMRCRGEAIVPDRWAGMFEAGIARIKEDGNRFEMP